MYASAKISAGPARGDGEYHDVCTGFEGAFERVGVEHAEVGLERLRVLDVDGETGSNDGVQSIERYESDSHRFEDNAELEVPAAVEVDKNDMADGQSRFALGIHSSAGRTDAHSASAVS